MNLSRQLELWKQISEGDTSNADPSALRSMRVYGSAQGIWVDKTTTGTCPRMGKVLRSASCTPGDITLTTYPTTGSTHRLPSRDSSEIQATKNAAALSLPNFVILPWTISTAKRSVQLGWVVDFDDENRQFFDPVRPAYA